MRVASRRVADRDGPTQRVRTKGDAMPTTTDSKRFLKIGEIIVSKTEEHIVWSILGSCVSIIFFVKDTLSILCHSQIPDMHHQERSCRDTCPNPCVEGTQITLDSKYVSCSLAFMLAKLEEEGIGRDSVRTTLVGGASILPRIGERSSVGDLNINTAKEILKNNGMKIHRESTGGSIGYIFWYNTKSDILEVKRHTDDKKIIL